MTALCLTFVMHLPVRLKHYSFFDIGECVVYEDAVRTFEVLDRAATELYLPAIQIWQQSLRAFGNDFRFALALSGILIEQFERFRPDVLEGLRKLAEHEGVEFLNMPCHHSLASAISPQEFREQVVLHATQLRQLTGRIPTAFQNTGLIYSDTLALEVETLGLQVIQAGAENLLTASQSPHQVYHPAPCTPSMRLLAVEDFRQEDGFPVASLGPVTSVSLPMAPDHPPTGEARWPEFLEKIPGLVLSGGKRQFVTPTQAAGLCKPAASITSKGECSAVKPYDLSPWRGNEMQKDAMDALYLLEARVKSLHDPALLRTWRILQDADQFSLMSTQSRMAPPPSPGAPYDAYINFMNILTDFTERLGDKV
jgi:alpha-amylase